MKSPTTISPSSTILNFVPAELATSKSRLFVPPDAIYCAAPDVDSKYNLPPASAAIPIFKLPLELISNL